MPLDLASGQFLAAPIVAPFPLPRWRAASMDGFAGRRTDFTHDGSVVLRLGGTTMAGDPEPPPLDPGTVWRVATGGRIPPNADTVIRQEDTRVDGAHVTVHDRRDVGCNVRAEGGDVLAGEVVLPAGSPLHAGSMAVAAALGVDHPVVVRRPRVLILSSGNELADRDHPDSVHTGERIADVNTPMLRALVHAAGGTPVTAPAVRDDLDAWESVLRQAQDVELILTAGAVSVGPHDHVPVVMDRLGGAIGFRRVRMRPGGPVTACRLPDGRPWLALPGNPISAWTTFLVLARPMIRAMLGDPAPGPTWAPHRLGQAIARHATLDLFVRVRSRPGGGTEIVEPTGPQESWRTTALALAEGIVHIPAGAGAVAAGELVDGVAVSLASFRAPTD